MPQKINGVVRVFNTKNIGGQVAGLEAGSAVFSQEATDAIKDIYPNSIIAVTNHHVVQEQTAVMLNFHHSEIPFPASVLKVCPEHDLAFLHVSMSQPEFKLANIDPMTGKQRTVTLVEGSSIVSPTLSDHITKVTAVGFPLGTSHQTITKGSITAMEIMKNNVVYYHDALINPGSSGGALLDTKGKLLGINTAIIKPGSTVSVAKPFSTVKSLISYLHPELSHPEFSPEAFRQLMSLYCVNTPPAELVRNFEAHKCGGVKQNNVSVTFADWFNKHCLDKPESHNLLQRVLCHLEEDPDRLHDLRENGWVTCGNCTPACLSNNVPTNVVPDRIIFNEHFKVSTTVPIMDRLTDRYGREGVVITDAQAHEPIKEGQLLVGINGRQLDNFGNFLDNRQPYFTAFKNSPGKRVMLNIGNTDKSVNDVPYVFSRLTSPPRIHSPGLNPFEKQRKFKIGGITVVQMNSAMAASYPEYLKPPMNDAVVGVVVSVDALCPEWNVQRIAPGHLLTRVNGKIMEGSLLTALDGANFITFEHNNIKFNKLIV